MRAACAARLPAAPWLRRKRPWPGFAPGSEQFELAVQMLQITFPYALFISLASLVGGVLNSYEKFAVPALSPVLLNISMIAAAVCSTPVMSRLGLNPVLALAWGVFFAGVLQLAFQLPALAKLGLLLVLATVLGSGRPAWQRFTLALLLAAVPIALTLLQPDLSSTALLVVLTVAMLVIGRVPARFLLPLGAAVVVAAPLLIGLLRPYQLQRLGTFLVGAHQSSTGSGWALLQARIALGSGGWSGRGFMQGTQSRLNFLPEKHTDFIFTTLAEEFGFVGSITLLGLYALVIAFCIYSAMTNRDRFASLLTLGIGGTFFLYFAVNMGMVMGLMPVVGVPLPLVSYGGTAMIVLLAAFGLVQSAHVHRPRSRD